MNLKHKKALAARTLGVGKERIAFVMSRLDEIKEMMTKQDVRELYKDGAIIIKEIRGRRKKTKRKNKRGPGKIKKRIKRRKQEYVALTRKLRAYVSELKRAGKISRELALELRKQIRNSKFRSKAHLKEYIRGLEK